MSELNPNQRVSDVVDALKRGVYRIPNIQRGYEWGQDRVTKLLDSLMSGYPIGAVMVWSPSAEIRADIPTRRFALDFDSTESYLSSPLGDSDGNAYLVLDGQQRLQSLYISFLGSYDGKRVYLNLDYLPTDEGDDTDYEFNFLTQAEATADPTSVRLSELVNVDVDNKQDFIKGIMAHLETSTPDSDEREEILMRKRIAVEKNIDRFTQQFNIRATLLFQEVDKRQNYDHVLEIFERVNSGGMVLSKSDLLFSTLKLKLAVMEQTFTDAVSDLNQGDRFSFNTDFLIKASLVIFDQRAKYDVVKLRNDAFVSTLKTRFKDLHVCMRQMSAWLDDVARIKSSRFLRSQNALIPILDYMMLSGNHDKPDGENGRAMTEYLYMAFFRGLFSRAADSVLDQLHNRMVEAVAKDKSRFPIEMIRDFMVTRQNIPYSLDAYYFTNSYDLMLNIVDGGVTHRTGVYAHLPVKDLKLEVDHIFPRSELSKKGMSDIANHFGNYRLIVMPANRRKSAVMPDQDTDFFGRKDANVEHLYKQALASLTRESYLAFRDARAERVRQEVTAYLGFTVPAK